MILRRLYYIHQQLSPIARRSHGSVRFMSTNPSSINNNASTPSLSSTLTSAFDYTRFCKAVSKYNKLYGNPWIATNFIVPKDDRSWPKAFRGYDLGSDLLVYRSLMRSKPWRDEFDEHPATNLLRECDFIESPRNQHNILLLESLKAYKKIYGEKPFTTTFIVPNTKYIERDGSDTVSNTFPRAVWGTQLGRTYANLKQRLASKKRRAPSDYYKLLNSEVDKILNS
jgi:hypothetical protein